jgi:hypothetical protein
MEQVKENNRFTQLLKALDTGWEIEEPVLLRTLWRTPLEGRGAYHFILKNRAEAKTTMVSLTPSPQLLVFLAERNISVNMW